MTAREVFGIIVRTFGLIVIILGLQGFLTAASLESPSFALGAFLLELAGFALLRGAEKLVEFAYPGSGPSARRGSRSRAD